MWYNLRNNYAGHGFPPYQPYALEVRSMSPKNTTESNKFHGKPCIKCGSALRYKQSKSCVTCKKQYAIKNVAKERERKHKWYMANKELTRERGCTWLENNRAFAREYHRQWEQSNKDKKRGYWENYSKNNREKINAKNKKWRKDNPEKHCAYQQKRRATKRALPSAPYDFIEICSRYGNKCLACGRRGIKLTIDHIIPISTGGHDTKDNIQPLCHSCNSSKGIKHIDYRKGVDL